MKDSSNRKSGFTLPEVMISAVIMAIAMAGSFSLMSWVTQATQFNGRYSQAAALAQDKLEELMANIETAQSGKDTDSIFTRVWTVASIGGMNAEKLEVEISWPRLRGGEHTTSFTSVVSPDTASTSNVGLEQPYASPTITVGSSGTTPTSGGTTTGTGTSTSPGNSGNNGNGNGNSGKKK